MAIIEVRDPDQPTGMAHMSWHFYGKSSLTKWPAVRVSQTTGKKQLQAWYEQFNFAWERSDLDHE